MTNMSEFLAGNEEYWEKLPQYIRSRVKASAREVDTPDHERAETALDSLNTFLEAEGVVGQLVKLDTSLPYIQEERIGEQGIETHPVVDPNILGKEYFEGTFMGCSLVSFENVENNYLFYNISDGSTGAILKVQGEVGSSRLKIHFPEVDPEEDEAETATVEAFNVLESVDDEEYLDVVQHLSYAYWNTDRPDADRIRELGMLTAILLEHPLQVDKARMDALYVLLSKCIDDEAAYEVEGITIDGYASKPDQISRTMGVERTYAPFIGRPVGIRPVPNFEIIPDEQGNPDVDFTESLQIAITYLDLNRNIEVDMPMRYTAQLNELQAYEERPTTRPFQTCGEAIREYEARQNQQGSVTSAEPQELS